MDQGVKYEPNELDRQAVMLFVARDVPREKIAMMLQISIDTMIKYYAKQLEAGKLIHEMELHRVLWNHAHGDNVTGSIKAATYLLDTIHRWNILAMDEVVDKVRERMREELEATLLKEKEAKYEC